MVHLRSGLRVVFSSVMLLLPQSYKDQTAWMNCIWTHIYTHTRYELASEPCRVCIRAVHGTEQAPELREWEHHSQTAGIKGHLFIAVMNISERSTSSVPMWGLEFQLLWKFCFSKWWWGSILSSTSSYNQHRLQRKSCQQNSYGIVSVVYLLPGLDH